MANANKIVSDYQQTLGKGDFAPARKRTYRVVPGAEVLSKAQEIARGIAQMRTKSIRAIMGAMNVPYRPKTFVAAVTALFEQRTIEFTD